MPPAPAEATNDGRQGGPTRSRFRGSVGWSALALAVGGGLLAAAPVAPDGAAGAARLAGVLVLVGLALALPTRGFDRIWRQGNGRGGGGAMESEWLERWDAY